MSTDQPKKLSQFGITAVALDQELQRFQQLVDLLKRTPLESRKQLERASKAVAEATESHARIAQRMGELAATLQDVRDRNEQCVQELNQHKRALGERMNEVGALLTRVQALGEAANAISQAVQALGEEAKEEGTSAQVLGELSVLMDRMDGIVAEAQSLAATAREARMGELAGEIESLRQQIVAARNKMNLMRERLAQAPTRPESH
jgi:chromosome segregation ATPase